MKVVAFFIKETMSYEKLNGLREKVFVKMS